MKVHVLVLAVCVASAYAAMSEEDKARFKRFKEECIAETGADPAVIQAQKSGGEVPRDAKSDCYHSCFQKKAGTQRADGTIDVEKALEMSKKWYDPEKATRVLNKCKDAGGKDACETAANLILCVYDIAKTV